MPSTQSRHMGDRRFFRNCEALKLVLGRSRKARGALAAVGVRRPHGNVQRGRCSLDTSMQ